MGDWTAIGLGFGSNLGDPAAAIACAVDTLQARGHVRIEAMSSLYRTVPWGPIVQPDFANACALAATNLAPRALLDEVKAAEVIVGRRPGTRWGPRAIDVDILFYAAAHLDEPDLVIPHASLFTRAFVLVPLAEIAPDLVVAGKRIADAAAQIGDVGVTPWKAAQGDREA